MTAVPIATTTRLRVPVLALGRYRGAVVLEVSRQVARHRRDPRGQRAADDVRPRLDRHVDQHRDAMLALRRGAGV